eukprot:EG_transcript_22308
MRRQRKLKSEAGKASAARSQDQFDLQKEALAAEARAQALREANDRVGELQAFASLASRCEKRGKVAMAQKYYRRSLDVAVEAQNVKGIMDMHHRLAVLHFSRRRYSRAVPHYVTAVALARQEGHADKLRRCFHELASIATIQHRHLEAADWLEKYLAVLPPGPEQDIHCKYSAHHRLAEAYGRLQDAEKVQHHRDQAELLNVRMKEMDQSLQVGLLCGAPSEEGRRGEEGSAEGESGSSKSDTGEDDSPSS